MADGRRRHDWSIASSMMALQANCHRDAKKRSVAYKPSDFDPFTEVVRQTVTVRQWAESLKVGGSKRGQHEDGSGVLRRTRGDAGG